MVGNRNVAASWTSSCCLVMCSALPSVNSASAPSLEVFEEKSAIVFLATTLDKQWPDAADAYFLGCPQHCSPIRVSRQRKNSHLRNCWDNLAKQLKALPPNLWSWVSAYPCEIAARPCEVGHKSGVDRIVRRDRNNRDCGGRFFDEFGQWR